MVLVAQSADTFEQGMAAAGLKLFPGVVNIWLIGGRGCSRCLITDPTCRPRPSMDKNILDRICVDGCEPT